MRTLLTSIFLVWLGIGYPPLVLGQPVQRELITKEGRIFYVESPIVDIDAPGALDRLARDNPEHYRKIREIVSEVQNQPDVEVAGWMRTRFDAHSVHYGPLLLVTHPPKRHLSFTIDEVRYKTIVTLTGWRAEPIPAK